MIIKKFQANSEKEAITLAQNDLGKEAIVMNIKTIKPKGLFKAFRKTIVEVTAAVDEASDKKAPVKENESRISSSFNASIDEKLHPGTVPVSEEDNEAKELEEKLNSLAMLLEQQMESQKAASKKEKAKAPKEETEKVAVKEAKKETALEKEIMVDAPVSKSAFINKDIKDDEDSDNKAGKGSLKDQSIDLIIEQLTGNEVSYVYAKQIIDEITHSGTIRTLDEMLATVYQKIILKLGSTKPIAFDLEDAKPKVIFFVGPTGVGKTTTIAKLSSKLLLDEKKKIAIFTSDTYRIAAVEQIKTYANILEIPVEVIYEPKDITNILPKYKEYDYVLVDTAGRSHKNKSQIDDLRKLKNAFDGYSSLTYLVLSATTKYKDLKKITDLYKDLTEYSLIFTKLDETDAIGNIINIKLDTGMPLSYVSYGQNVPDDIEVINPQVIAKQLLGGEQGYGSGN